MGQANGRQSIFITGAASGMGLETARLFAGKGWFVGGYDVNAEGLARLEAELGPDNCVVQTLDVTDREAYRAAVEAFGHSTNGRMDVLYNNAGIGRGGLFVDQAWEDIMAVAQVNFIAVMSGIHLAAPLLKATPGSLCFTTSSSSGTIGIPGIAVYSATKHAVKGLTEALSVELRPFGVRAADVLPGMIDTPLMPPGAIENAPKEGMFRAMPASSVAEVVWAAYNHPTKLHWYVPDEIYDLDKAATLDPEGTRDEMASGALFASLLEAARAPEAA